MPTRIRSSYPAVSGGGGGGGAGGTVEWGPNFGEPQELTVNAVLDLEQVLVFNDKTVGDRVTMPNLGVENTKTLGHNLTIALGAQNDKTVGDRVTMPTLAVENTKNVGNRVTMPDLAPANTKSVGHHLSGSVLGAPFWQSIEVNSSTTTTVTNLTITKPSGTVQGDLLVAVIVRGANTDDTAAEAGWTKLTYSGRTGVLQIGLTVYYKIAGASEGASYGFSWAASNACFGNIQRFSAVDSTTPINVSANNNGSTADPVCTNINTTVVNTMRVCYCGQASAVNVTYLPPSGMAERAEQDGNGAASSHLIDGSTATRVQAASGGSGDQTFDQSGIVGTDWATIHLAIAPGTLTIAS